LTINALAKDMVMDRTTLGRNILPLQRNGLIRIEPIASDRRVKDLHLTNTGEKRLQAARKAWSQAQAQFETNFGTKTRRGPSRVAALCRRYRIQVSGSRTMQLSI
jgi:DNA-binding MarR family transcriptional regulator